MAVVLVRVDSRLFHGQVLEGWIPSTGTTMVIVADNLAASNMLQKKVMQMAAPDHLKLRIESIDDAVADIESHQYDEESIMIIFSSTHDAFEAYQKGIRYGSINLGNLSWTSGKKQVTESLALNDGDVEDIKALAALGVDIDVRGVPKGKRTVLNDLLQRYSRMSGSRD